MPHGLNKDPAAMLSDAKSWRFDNKEIAAILQRTNSTLKEMLQATLNGVLTRSFPVLLPISLLKMLKMPILMPPYSCSLQIRDSEIPASVIEFTLRKKAVCSERKRINRISRSI